MGQGHLTHIEFFNAQSPMRWDYYLQSHFTDMKTEAQKSFASNQLGSGGAAQFQLQTLSVWEIHPLGDTAFRAGSLSPLLILCPCVLLSEVLGSREGGQGGVRPSDENRR